MFLLDLLLPCANFESREVMAVLPEALKHHNWAVKNMDVYVSDADWLTYSAET